MPVARKFAPGPDRGSRSRGIRSRGERRVPRKSLSWKEYTSVVSRERSQSASGLPGSAHADPHPRSRRAGTLGDHRRARRGARSGRHFRRTGLQSTARRAVASHPSGVDGFEGGMSDPLEPPRSCARSSPSSAAPARSASVLFERGVRLSRTFPDRRQILRGLEGTFGLPRARTAGGRETDPHHKAIARHGALQGPGGSCLSRPRKIEQHGLLLPQVSPGRTRVPRGTEFVGLQPFCACVLPEGRLPALMLSRPRGAPTTT
jgi:hypothetical protein